MQSGFFSLGAAALPEFEGSDDLQVVPLIVSNVRFANGMSFELEGITARADLVTDDYWRGGPIANLTFGRDEDNVGSAALRALDSVDTAFELGVFAGVSFPLEPPVLPAGFFTADISVRQDVVDAHEGLLATAEAEFAFPVNERIFVSLEATATYASDDYMDAFFGIDARGAAASGLGAFSADAGLKDVGIGLVATYAVDERWGLFTRLGYNRLVGDAADSPIVRREGSPDQLFIGLGLSWNF